MSTKKKLNKIHNSKYAILLDLIAIIAVSTFAYTTAIIVVSYQMGV